MEDIRGVEEVEEKEELVEVMDRLFSIIVGCKGTMHGSVRIRRACHANTAPSLTIR